jgi:2-methylisocitrate lyase-like PEP mutase family enzyme
MAKHADVSLLQMKDVLDASWNSARAVNIPVTSDVDSGDDDVRNGVGATERINAVGLAGMNIEDQSETTVTATTNESLGSHWQRAFSNLTARTII